MPATSRVETVYIGKSCGEGEGGGIRLCYHYLWGQCVKGCREVRLCELHPSGQCTRGYV